MLTWLKKKFDPNVSSSSQVIQDEEEEVGCEVEEETILNGSMKEESKSVNESKGERKLIWGGLGVCEVRDEHVFEGLLFKVTEGAKVDGGTELTMEIDKEGKGEDTLQSSIEGGIVIQEKQTVDSGGGEGIDFQEAKLSHGVEERTCMKNVKEVIEPVQTVLLEYIAGKEENVDSDEISSECQKGVEESLRDIACKHEGIVKENLDGTVSEDEVISQEMPRSSEDRKVLSDNASKEEAVTIESSQSITFMFEKVTEGYMKGITSKDEGFQRKHLSEHEGLSREILTDTPSYVGSVEESGCCNKSVQEKITRAYLDSTLEKDGDMKEERFVGITTEIEQIDEEVLHNIASKHEDVLTAFMGITTKCEQSLGSLILEHRYVTKDEYKSPVSFQHTSKVSANVMKSDAVGITSSNLEEDERESKEKASESSEIDFRIEQEEKGCFRVKVEASEVGIDSPKDDVRSIHISHLESEQHFTGTSHDLSRASREVTGKGKEEGSENALVKMKRGYEGIEDGDLKEWNALGNMKSEEVTQKTHELCTEKYFVVEKNQIFEGQLNEGKVFANIECEEVTKKEKEENGGFGGIEDGQMKNCNVLKNILYGDIIKKTNEEYIEKSHTVVKKESFEGYNDEQLKEYNEVGSTSMKFEGDVQDFIDFESKRDSITTSSEACEKANRNFFTFSEILLDLNSIIVLYPSNFSIYKTCMVKPDQGNNVHKLHPVSSYMGPVNRSHVPHLSNLSLEQDILNTNQMGLAFEQSISTSQQGDVSPRPLGTTLFNQIGKICNVLDRKCILAKVFGYSLIVEIGTAFMHLVSGTEYYSSDSEKNAHGMPVAHLNSYHCLEKPQLGKSELKREVIRIVDIPEGTVVMFDAVDMSQDDKRGFEAVVLWQGCKPAITISPLDISYIVLKSQEGCQAEIQVVYKAWTRIAVEFGGDTIEVRVRNSIIFYQGKCISKATLRKLKKQGMMFKANVYLLCRMDGTQQFISTCVWCEGKPPQDVSLNFNTCYTLESDIKEKQGGHHQKLVTDYPAQISRGSGDKGALLTFVDEFGVFVKISLSDAFLDVFSSEVHRRKEMAVWIHFRRIFSVKKMQEVVAIQTVPEKAMVLPITLTCPLPGCQLENGTVIKKRKDIDFEASDEERLGLESSSSSKMLKICVETVKESDGLTVTDSSGKREENILGKIYDITHFQTQKASASATVVLSGAPNTHPFSSFPSVYVSPPLPQVTSITSRYSSSPRTQADYASSKLTHNVPVQPVIPPSLLSTSSVSEAVRSVVPVLPDSPPSLAVASPVADRMTCLDQRTSVSVTQHLPDQNCPGLHSAVLINQKAALRHRGKGIFVLESDSERDQVLIDLKGQELVVQHERLVDITACVSGSIINFDALWTGYKYEPILLWQGPKPCIVAHQEEQLFFDVSAVIISSSESNLVLQVQDGHRLEEFNVKVEKKEVLTRGEKLQSCVVPGRWVLVHLKKKTIDDKFDWFLMLLTIEHKIVDTQLMDPAFVTLMIAEDYSLISSYVNENNFGSQKEVKTLALNEEAGLAESSQQDIDNPCAQKSPIYDDSLAEMQESDNHCFLSGEIVFRSKQLGILQCLDGHVVLFYIGRFFIGSKKISSTGDLTKLPLSLCMQAKTIALPTSHYEGYGITHEALITYIGVPTFISNYKSVLDIVHLNPCPQENEVFEILNKICEEKPTGLLGVEDEQNAFQSYSGIFEDLNSEKVKFTFNYDGKRRQLYLAKKCLYPKVELPDSSRCGVLICRQTSFPLVGWLHINVQFEKHKLEVIKGFSVTAFDEDLKLITLCSGETTLICEYRTDVIHMGKIYKGIGNGLDILDKHMHFITEALMVNDLECESIGHIVLFISSSMCLTKTMHKVMMNTNECMNCIRDLTSHHGEMEVQDSRNQTSEREHIKECVSQTYEISSSEAHDHQTDKTPMLSLVLEEQASKVPKHIAILDNPDFDMSHINEEWNNIVREVTSCSSGITFCFHGIKYLKMFGSEWKTGYFDKCFTNGWYLIDCWQDEITVLIHRDQIYSRSHLCFQQNNPEGVYTLVLLYETIICKKVQNLTINGYAVAAWMDNKTADIPFHSCPNHQPTHISVWPYEQEPEFLISDIIMMEVKGIVKPPSTYIFGCSGHMLSIRTSAPECGTMNLELADRKLLSTVNSSSLLNGEQFENLLGKECYSIVKTDTVNTRNLLLRNYKALMVWGVKSSNIPQKSDSGGECCSSAVKFCVDEVINSFKYIIAHGSIVGFKKSFPKAAITPETLLLIEMPLPGRGRKVKILCSASRVIGIAMQGVEQVHDCCFLVPREVFLFIAKERQIAYEKADHEIFELPRERHEYPSYEEECIPVQVEGESASVDTEIKVNEPMAGTEGDREKIAQIPDCEMEIKTTEQTYSRRDFRKFTTDEEDVYLTDEENRFTAVRNLLELNISRGERHEFKEELYDEKKLQFSEDKCSECRWEAKKIGNSLVKICMYRNEIIFKDSIVAVWPKDLPRVYTRLCHVHGIIPLQPEERLVGRQMGMEKISRNDWTAKELLRENECTPVQGEIEMLDGEVKLGSTNDISDKVEYNITPHIGNRGNVQNAESETDTDHGDYYSTTNFDDRSSMNESVYSNLGVQRESFFEKDEGDLKNEILRSGFSMKNIPLSRMLEKQIMTENESSDQLIGASSSVASYSSLSNISSESARQGSGILYDIIPPNVKDLAKMQSRCRDLSTIEDGVHSQESEVFYKTCAHVQSDATQAVVSFTKDGVKKYVHVSKKKFFSGEKKLSKKSSLDEVINIDRPVGVYLVQLQSTKVIWEYIITHKAVMAFIGKKPSICNTLIEKYLADRKLHSFSERLESKKSDGSVKSGEKLKPHGVDHGGLKKMQSHGAVVLRPHSNSTIHMSGRAHSASFTYAFAETKKKNVIFFWHSCVDSEAKHMSDFLTKSGGIVKAEVVSLTEEFQVFDIHVTHVAVLVWFGKNPKQKSVLIQQSLQSFPWIIRSWDPLYIQPQLMCKPRLVKKIKSGYVTHHSNKLVILQCCDHHEDTIYVSFNEEAIHPFFAETFCEHLRTVRLSLNKVVNLFGMEWYCFSEDTEPKLCNGIYITQKALQVWPSSSQIRKPVEILSVEDQTFCIVSCHVLYTNDDFGIVRLKKKGLALFFRMTCDWSCQSILDSKDKCNLQSGVMKLSTPVHVQNNVVHWLALKIWGGEISDELIQQMELNLDVLPWKIWSWNPLLLTWNCKPSPGLPECAYLKEHSTSPHEGIVAASPHMPSSIKTKVILNPAESPEVKSGTDSVFYTSGTIIKIMKSSAVLECTKKDFGNFLVFCKKSDFYVNREASPKSNNFEKWLEPYVCLKFNCLARKVKPMDVGGTEVFYISTRVWAKTSESVPILSVNARIGSTISIDAENKKGCTVGGIIKEKKKTSLADSKKGDTSAYKHEFKHMLKGKVTEVHSTVCQVVGDGGDKYYVSSSQCFLYGICLSCVELWHVLHTGLCVYLELHEDNHNDIIKHVWIGEVGNKSPSETHQAIEKWCSENMVSVAMKDIMLLQTGYVDPMLAPVAVDSEEDVRMATGKF